MAIGALTAKMTARASGAAILATWALVGGLVVLPSLRLPVLAAAGLVFLVALGSSVLLPLLVATTFVTRLRFDLLGASFRLEHAVLVACLVALLLEGRLGALVDAARDRTAALFAVFIAWSGLVSATQSLEPDKSLLIVGWLAIDWLILVVLVASVYDARTLAADGARWAAVAAASAVALWIAAHAFGTRLGVVTEHVTGSLAALGLSHEPNILGTALAVWAFVVVSCPSVGSPRLRRIVLSLAVAGILVSFTRAAVIALAGGLLVWAVIRGATGRRTAFRIAGSVAVAVVVLSLIAPGIARPMLIKGSQALNFGTGTGQLRVQQWQLALDDMSGMAWVMGLGTNSFGQRHLEPTLPETPTPAYLGNLPLQVLYDTGAIGVVLLGALVSSVLTRRRLRDGRATGLLVTYVLGAVATSPFWFGSTWVLVAMALIDRRRIEKTEAGDGRPVLARS